jgi:hypothetical protein
LAASNEIGAVDDRAKQDLLGRCGEWRVWLARGIYAVPAIAWITV